MALTFHEDIAPQTALVIRTSDRTDGSMAVTEPGFQDNLAQFWPTSGPVTWLKQVHGDRIVTVDHPGEHAGCEADGAFATADGVTLAVTTADCAPVVIAAVGGDVHALAVVHAGWRGLQAGIIEKAARMVLHRVPEGVRFAFCGPCIGPAHYEFSAVDLEPLVERYGGAVKSHTESGTAALDLFAGVSSALTISGFPVPDRPPSTAGAAYFSHRTGTAERRTGRMLTLAQLLHT